MMLALDATSMVGKKMATPIMIIPENIKATYGVFRLGDILAKILGSIRSRPRAYDARVAE